MKKRLLQILFCAAGAAVFAAGGAGVTFGEDEFGGAVQLYQEGNFQEAAREFEGILRSGVSSAALYYDLGNCYFRLGMKAKAVWAYEKAAVLDPRDGDIEWNLNLVRKQLQDKQEAPPRFFIMDWLSGLVRELESDELAVAFAACLGVLSALLVLYAFFGGLRVFIQRLLPLVAAASAAAGLFTAVRWNEMRFPSAVVADEEVYVRYGPSDDATRAFLLHEGTKVTVVRESGKWFLIQFGLTQKGWLPQEAVMKI